MKKKNKKKKTAKAAYLIKQQIYENQCENSPEIFFSKIEQYRIIELRKVIYLINQ